MSTIVEHVLRTNIYTQPVHLFLAIITNVLNIRILCSRTLRLSPCTHYFLAYAIFSILYACLLCPIQFARGFAVNLVHDDVSCKLHAYLLFVIPCQANLMIVLASFDRYCSSVQVARLQTSSAARAARKNILVAVLFSAVFMLPMAVIYRWNASAKKCIVHRNVIIDFYVSSQLLLYYFLSPILLVVFGTLTIYNIHEQSTRVRPLVPSTRRRRTEGQLARMLFLQVVVHFVLVLPFGVVYSVNSFVPSTQTPQIIALRLIFVTWQQCDYFMSFFLYVLSANIYREELIRIVKALLCADPLPNYLPRVQYNKIDVNGIGLAVSSVTDESRGKPETSVG